MKLGNETDIMKDMKDMNDLFGHRTMRKNWVQDRRKQEVYSYVLHDGKTC